MQFNNKLAWLNAGNETGFIQTLVLENLMGKFPKEELVGLEVGSAYGGGVEFGAWMFKGRGKFYGYDTFEGHPKDLAIEDGDLEQTCMDMWYNNPMFGTEKIKYDYQRKILDEDGLDNAILVKGRINKHSFDDIEKVHFAILDLDLITPMRIAYKAIRDKIVIGGYLFIHDALPADHLPMIHDLAYKEILQEGDWMIVKESEAGNLLALEKWVNVIGNLRDRFVDLNV